MNAPAHIRGQLSHAPLSLRAQRYDWVLEMRTRGFGFSEISAALGLGPTAAINIYGRGDPRAPDTCHQAPAMPTRYDVTVRRADGLMIKHTIAADRGLPPCGRSHPASGPVRRSARSPQAGGTAMTATTRGQRRTSDKHRYRAIYEASVELPCALEAAA